ncbi:hypothetical protein HJC99_05000 [Candidatus Saccharibacteria bacterium]|nr:hypothetical protein [Candidatus Saccharibacteria bacterium]
MTTSWTNTGLNKEDVFVVFSNPDALHALNNLGTYGEVHIVGNNGPVFDSANLNDNSASCVTFSPSGCWPVAKSYKIGTNITPGGTGSWTFTFGYASKLSTQSAAGGGDWNSYPLGGPTNSGLPYQLVAVQPGQTP